MAGRGDGSSSAGNWPDWYAGAAPLGRGNAPNLPPYRGYGSPGEAGSWLLMFGPPLTEGGPPRTLWVDGRRVTFGPPPPPVASGPAVPASAPAAVSAPKAAGGAA
eukprot:8201706-Alexandrium_andersonii.AAC.1